MDLIGLYTPDDITEAVNNVGSQIAADYADKNPIFVGVLTGSFVFVADLIRAAAIPSEVDFIRARSYGTSMESSGAVEITKDIEHDVRDRHVILVEDILDTGLTLRFLKEALSVREPASLKVCTLLDKPERRRVEIAADYVAFTIPDAFVVGYGLDLDQNYRHLPYVAVYDPA